jgi:hypothetical protein
MQEYNISFASINLAQYVTSNCNEITFINLGTNNVTINNTLTLQPTQSLSISGNACEVDVTNYNVNFNNSVGSNLIVIRKFFKC